MSRCGLHTSTAGGLGEMLARAKALGEDAAQIFVKSNRQWRLAPLAVDEAEAFRKGKGAGDLWVCAHAGYLINVAGSGEIRKNSIRSLAEELMRAETLGLEALVVHCGSRGEAHPAEARKTAIAGFREALEISGTRSIPLALENSAGQGSSLARDLEEWGELVAELPAGRRAACLDTAHAFAAGHDLRSEAGRTELIREVEEINSVRLFKPYKDLCGRIAGIMREYNPTYPYPHSLSSTLIEMAHFQHYFMLHLPSLTNFSAKKDPNEIILFLDNLVFSTLSQSGLNNPTSELGS